MWVGWSWFVERIVGGVIGSWGCVSVCEYLGVFSL